MIFKKILISIAKGLFDILPVIPNFKNNVNENSGVSPEGKVDYLRLSTSLVTIIILLLFFFGKIDYSQLKELIESFL